MLKWGGGSPNPLCSAEYVAILKEGGVLDIDHSQP